MWKSRLRATLLAVLGLGLVVPATHAGFGLVDIIKKVSEEIKKRPNSTLDDEEDEPTHVEGSTNSDLGPSGDIDLAELLQMPKNRRIEYINERVQFSKDNQKKMEELEDELGEIFHKLNEKQRELSEIDSSTQWYYNAFREDLNVLYEQGGPAFVEATKARTDNEIVYVEIEVASARDGITEQAEVIIANAELLEGQARELEVTKKALDVNIELLKDSQADALSSLGDAFHERVQDVTDYYEEADDELEELQSEQKQIGGDFQKSLEKYRTETANLGFDATKQAAMTALYITALTTDTDLRDWRNWGKVMKTVTQLKRLVGKLNELGKFQTFFKTHDEKIFAVASSNLTLLDQLQDGLQRMTDELQSTWNGILAKANNMFDEEQLVLLDFKNADVSANSPN